MDIEYNNFIGIYKNVFEDGFCEHIISEFERVDKLGVVTNRCKQENIPQHIKNDDFAFFDSLNFHADTLKDFEYNNNSYNLLDFFYNGLQSCYDDYVNNFSYLKEMKIGCTQIKVQRTSPGGGYHLWHPEKDKISNWHRVLVYSLYLNDVVEGGETEFLYQRLRVNSQKNKVIIWPADWTHTHRGNPNLSDKYKYIATGWFYVHE